MKILLSDIGKRYGKNWLFRHVNAEFLIGDRIGIKGINGSGKSSLLKLIAGISLPSEGKLNYYSKDEKEIDLNQLAGKISLVSPYMDVPEQLSIREIFLFQESFIPFKKGIDLNEFLEIIFLKGKEGDLIKSFSSGMKQRLKLGLAFLSSSPVLFLDEPCSNLDNAGKELYARFLNNFSEERIIFIASNEESTELIHCNKIYDLNQLSSTQNKTN